MPANYVPGLRMPMFDKPGENYYMNPDHRFAKRIPGVNLSTKPAKMRGVPTEQGIHVVSYPTGCNGATGILKFLKDRKIYNVTLLDHWRQGNTSYLKYEIW